MLNELIRSWQNVVLHPSAQSLRAERPGADYRKVWLAVVIWAIVAAVAVLIGQIVNAALQISLGPLFGARNGLDQTGAVAGLSIVLAIGIAALTFVGTLATIWISSGIYWLSARAFGAHGSYKDQTYLISLVEVPIGLVSSVLSIIPFLGAFVALGVSVYGIVLTVFAIQATHDVSGGRAFLIWLVPFLIVLGLVCICAVIILVLVAAGLSGASRSF